MIYINVLGDSDEEIVRAIPPEQLKKQREKDETFSYYGLATENLSKQERETLNYLNN
jgi:hypothetical protein